MMQTETVTRRAALGAAVGAVGAASALAFSGCGAKNCGWDGSSYLPIGSVVRLKAYASTDVMHVVITRRPKVSQTFTRSDDGTLEGSAVAGVYDYALLLWPIGVFSDFAQQPGRTDTTFANADEISEVLFMGYEDDAEKSAEEALASSKGSGTTCAEALLDLVKELAGKKEEG